MGAFQASGRFSKQIGFAEDAAVVAETAQQLQRAEPQYPDFSWL